jgi:hypothetical protein
LIFTWNLVYATKLISCIFPIRKLRQPGEQSRDGQAWVTLQVPSNIPARSEVAIPCASAKSAKFASAIFCGRVVKKAARQSLFIADRNLRFNRFEHGNGASSAPPNTIVAGIDRFQFDDSCAARFAPST